MQKPSFVLTALLFVFLPLAHAQPPVRTYDLDYRVEMKPETGIAAVTISLSGERLPSRLVFKIDPERHRNFSTPIGLQTGAREITWEPQGRKAELHYEFVVSHKRSDSGYDAVMQKDWAIFRGDSLVPRVKVKAKRNLRSRATLHFVLPPQWSAVTALGPTEKNEVEFDQPRRHFDRPTGWMLMGKLGKRSERIAGVTTTVAAPLGNDARRQDMLAFLSWNLPRLIEVFPKFPTRVLIVSAGDPMWHGGLSGPGSLYIHTERPLISENRTSTLLHELVHVAMGIRGAEDSDWIVEGLAEYYSLETLRRSRGISTQRYDEALRRLERWSRKAASLRVKHSSGPVTAKAVLVFKAADDEIRAATNGERSLDDVAMHLAGQREAVTLEDLQALAKKIAGRDVHAFARIQ